MGAVDTRATELETESLSPSRRRFTVDAVRGVHHRRETIAGPAIAVSDLFD